ncbi:hypothetical protein [Hymenobacter rubripertinctus]|uniref:DUF2029 domain-containing protein n=1 Tax=Hymenobacter rubripertinctus TaxID=2029981 RepID=A0A418QJB9_9BACT|nr:hypothetical protein [Hymenobacter rubripertinctus]RIY05209.1 hypothetical protein D0T11_20840 [Hymenobacter rubripertinctus]
MVQNFYRNPKAFFTLFILAITSFYWIFPDIMPFHQGFAFEGYTLYKPLAIDLYEHLIVHPMNSYSIQRIFPYVLLHITFKLFGISFTDFNMILFFQIFQLVVALIIIYTWDKLAKHLTIGLAGQWIGYLSMLVNFATLKLDFYIPFTYDRLAMAAGLISLYFYLTHRPLGLFITALVSLTIWPTALFFNLLMLLIPVSEVVPTTRNPWLSRVWAAGIASAVCGLFIVVIYIKHIPDSPNLAPIVRPLLPLSILVVGAYLFYTLTTLAQKLFPGWQEIIPRITQLLRPRLSWLYSLLILGAYFFLTRYLGDPNNQNLTPQLFAVNLTFGALQRPGQSLIFHVLYYGLPFILIALFWRRTLQVVTQLGLGTGLLVMAVLIQAVNNETRQMANVIPLLSILAAMVADGLNPRPKVVAVTALLAFAISKAWVVSLNYFSPDYGNPGDIFPMQSLEQGDFLTWPRQAYFMNFGPWSATPYLLIQTVAAIIAFYVIHRTWNSKELVHKQ